ncbi:MAG: integrase core domain-containing protein, partial [Gemmatimonadota bacterium]|nr:integrase core domain-containing protein [Gemmatimonadota bacterium]
MVGLNLDTVTFTGNATGAEWQAALTSLDTAVGTLNSSFGDIGAAQNRIGYAMQNTDSSAENLAAAESVIREIFYTLPETVVLIEQWRRLYNTVRPHSAYGGRPPAPET